MEIEKRKDRWKNFYDLKSDTKTLVLIDYFHGERPWPYPENIEKRIDFSAELYKKQTEFCEWLDDDRIPALNPYTGTEIFACAFGCGRVCPGDNMPFALHAVKNSAEAAALKEPDIYGLHLGELFEIARRLRQRCGNGAPLHLPDIQSPLDVAALIWEKTDFYAAMISEPEAVRELVAKTERVLIRFLDAWFKEFGTEYIAHYPDYFMDGGVTLSEDEIGAISPAFFYEFCLPSLNKLSARYGGIGVHCCANSEHQWENFKKIENLRLINLVQPPKTIRRAYEFFKDHTSMMNSWCGEGEPSPEWAGNFPENARVILTCGAGSKDEAISLCAKLREIEDLRK